MWINYRNKNVPIIFIFCIFINSGGGVSTGVKVEFRNPIQSWTVTNEIFCKKTLKPANRDGGEHQELSVSRATRDKRK
jgi:hypothetical protein